MGVSAARSSLASVCGARVPHLPAGVVLPLLGLSTIEDYDILCRSRSLVIPRPPQGMAGVEGREVGFVENIRAWLSKLGLSQYAEAFEHNDVALDLLQTLTDQDLRELGVDSMRHRKMLLSASAELKGAETPTLFPPVEALRATPVTPAPTPAPSANTEAERPQLTVVFCDLGGSTVLCGR